MQTGSHGITVLEPERLFSAAEARRWNEGSYTAPRARACCEQGPGDRASHGGAEMTVELDTDRTGAQGPPIDAAALGRLGRCLHGELVRPGHPSYDERRRVWNGSIDRHPAVIVRCLDAADVSAAVTFATVGPPPAVRGGGHSFAGSSVCDGGVVVDLGPMKRIRVDPERRVVQAEAGVLLGELDRATQAYGLAVPLGSVTHTGAGRPDARWWHRLADAQVRADGRPAPVGRYGHRGWQGPQGQPGRERRPAPGCPRRRWYTSASSPSSNSRSTLSDRWFTPASCSGLSTRQRRRRAATATGRSPPRTS